VNYQIAIFSYNRCAYLRNCVESVQRHCSGVHFTIFDDGSDEPELVAYLRSLGNIVRHMQSGGKDRHGGFYANMQAALNEATANCLLLLQDDVQVVRDITKRDIQFWQNYWLQHDDCAFLSPVFLKGGRRRDFLKYYQISPTNRVYHWVEDDATPSKDGPVPHYYMDVCLLHVDRLRQVGWQYQQSEYNNGQQASQQFKHGMPQLPEPFVFYVPEEPVFRSRVKSKGTQIAERFAGNSVKRFISMTSQDVEAMEQRHLSAYPFAEDFIRTEDPNVQRPFRFNVYRTHWLARLINKIEKLWTR